MSDSKLRSGVHVCANRVRQVKVRLGQYENSTTLRSGY